jgi:hypothetical protein
MSFERTIVVAENAANGALFGIPEAAILLARGRPLFSHAVDTTESPIPMLTGKLLGVGGAALLGYLFSGGDGREAYVLALGSSLAQFIGFIQAMPYHLHRADTR